MGARGGPDRDDRVTQVLFERPCLRRRIGTLTWPSLLNPQHLRSQESKTKKGKVSWNVLEDLGPLSGNILVLKEVCISHTVDF